jgi:hypothetical protein
MTESLPLVLSEAMTGGWQPIGHSLTFAKEQGWMKMKKLIKSQKVCQSCGDVFQCSNDEKKNQKVTLCPECRGWAKAYSDTDRK